MAIPLPLEGVRIADFSQQLVGPYGTAYFAWLGAEVIRIESKLHPELIRARGKVRQGDSNINKLSISLNLQHPEGVRIAKNLVKISDIAVENFSPGTMEKLGLSYAELKKVKPDIIMLSASGFGQTGIERGYRAWAALFAGMGGLSSITGYRDGLPTAMRLSLDTMTGQHWTVAVLAALLHHRETGEGQYIDFSARDAIVNLIGDNIIDYEITGVVPELKGNDDDWASPHNNYACKGKDQWVSIAVFTEEEWHNMCRAIGKDELTEDPRFCEPLQRWANRQELDEIISSWTINHSPQEVTEILQAVGVAAVPILSSDQIYHDPHLEARGFIRQTSHQKWGKFLAFGPPWQLARSPIPIKWAGPEIGEHNPYVLGTLLGLDKNRISELEKDGVLE